ncbi:phosphoribosylamine--glycine ligase [Spiribacter vilamensis]|uniref:Phosphoribosylamine--glycine ligase n=1 Tax=Spiribacter vilamensis TaxID=531306 RepID=A0A4Q8D300_9GAMM|nr:phosphoribosylamine--glycine ligase [Spiribacter vilamensis]RZU99700.1 phosphoribosylamine--glycine ligase [Spiribacter vilamensis]TVO61351.1 phosphoribosylamine--glycine ligase [Spiribacter vilamensis]
MKILVVGNGGREHAMAWRLARSPRSEHVYVAPGNAGTALEDGVSNVDTDVGDIPGLIERARALAVDMTVIGPEAPLAAGIVDAFEAAGLVCLGPHRAAAELEASKAFAKAFFARHDIPGADSRTFDALAPAQAYIRERGAPLVIKADGLAAGKGVTIAHSVEDALAAAADMLDGAFGAAGERIVVEDFLTGEEASFIALVDGETVLPLASSQDHKARDAGDVGPNTGGMGAYSPAPVVTDAVHERILESVIRPTVQGLVAEGRGFKGFLYAGLMIDAEGEPRVLEFNVRLGDPETQPIFMRLASDPVTLFEAALTGRLDEQTVAWDPRPCLGVVLAAAGYPGGYERGHVIEGLIGADTDERKLFHAGTATDSEGRPVTAGGRVLCACALGTDITAAQKAAYDLADGVRWPGRFMRPDIGHRAVELQLHGEES